MANEKSRNATSSIKSGSCRQRFVNNCKSVPGNADHWVTVWAREWPSSQVTSPARLASIVAINSLGSILFT